MMAIGLTVEFLAWTTGVGAAIITGLGRWYTVPPPITAPPVEPTAAAACLVGSCGSRPAGLRARHGLGPGRLRWRRPCRPFFKRRMILNPPGFL